MHKTWRTYSDLGGSKFHEYIFSREFTIFTYSKPLLGILKEKQIVPPTASAKGQRQALILSSYHYKIVYYPGSKILNAYGLICLLMKDNIIPLPCPEEIILSMSDFDLTPVTVKAVVLHI